MVIMRLFIELSKINYSQKQKLFLGIILEQRGVKSNYFGVDLIELNQI
tara:strand:- start:13970 stop:14113 length:144 start_codon:yes stop_codon:yes gene_type:complete